MMRLNKYHKIIITLMLLFALMGFSFWYSKIYIPQKKIAQKCIGFDPKWEDLIDCHGVLSINAAWDVRGYYLYDHVHNYELAEIDNLNDYKFQDGKVYIKNRAALNCSVTDKYGKKQFCQNLFQDGQMKDSYYDKESDIPLYLVIDTQTGNVKAYKTISEVPEHDRSIFQELEKSLPR